MDPRYSHSTHIPHYDDHLSNSINNSSTTSLPSHVNRTIPIISRYFHRAPLIVPQHHHQQRLRGPPARYSSSYLGPLHQHRQRFLSAWDLAPKPTIYSSSRNLASSTSTPFSILKQHDDQGSCILNSCALR